LVETLELGSTSLCVKLNGGLQQPLLKHAQSHPASQRSKASGYNHLAPGAVLSAAGALLLNPHHSPLFLWEFRKRGAAALFAG